MTTPPTPEPSAEALAAARSISKHVCVAAAIHTGVGQLGVARIIDAEFAALRARLARAEEAFISTQKTLVECIVQNGGKIKIDDLTAIEAISVKEIISFRDEAARCFVLKIRPAMSAPSAKPGEGGK